ncbi:hypothetical protein COMA1_10442 [Candidatus Nitrospira nitrosa]|uniref:Uncharacterized protein n=1 Tax=Candidatus Nitrospira nitrosa TaxID=1742972 RepID=A0A0S4L5R5_9BACT|nr:hypothetical protein COMA1_10442 [Candidatus Nitrospira nitrosa]
MGKKNGAKRHSGTSEKEGRALERDKVQPKARGQNKRQNTISSHMRQLPCLDSPTY